MLPLDKRGLNFSQELRREIIDLQAVADEEKLHKKPVGSQNVLRSMTPIVAVGMKTRLLKVVEEMIVAIEVGTVTATVSAAVEMTMQKTTRTKVGKIRQTAALLAVVTTIEGEIAETEMMDHRLTFQHLAVMIIMVATVLHPHIAVTTTHCQILHPHLQDRPTMTVDGAVTMVVARTATETAIEIVAAAEGIVNETLIATMRLAVVINLCHANGVDLVMIIMDMETAVHVECAWEAKVNGRVEVHNRHTWTFLHGSYFFSSFIYLVFPIFVLGWNFFSFCFLASYLKILKRIYEVSFY
jgi:hypothetical protein